MQKKNLFKNLFFKIFKESFNQKYLKEVYRWKYINICSNNSMLKQIIFEGKVIEGNKASHMIFLKNNFTVDHISKKGNIKVTH